MKPKFASLSDAGGLVYSTDGGRICPVCRQPVAHCVCASQPAISRTDGVVRVSLETKGRSGKGVTVVRGLALDLAGLTALSKRLKAACGSGGTVKDGTIEVQGDHCDRVMADVKKLGLTVKRSGG